MDSTQTFIYDSYSCRLGKGTHKAVRRLEKFARKLSKNYKQNFWVLKFDISKFFDSVDHTILKILIAKRDRDKEIVRLICQVIDSFHSKVQSPRPRGIPLGNLTSQIFANIYLNELDQFIKHNLKIKYYLRYADDCLMLSTDLAFLYRCIDTLKQFLTKNLRLELHPQKIIIRKLAWGIDFCGYIVLPHHTLVRTKTKRRIFKKILGSKVNEQAFQSYLGYFSHASGYGFAQNMKNIFRLAANRL